MVWSFDESINGPNPWREGRDLHFFQPSFSVTSVSEDDDGRTVWRLSEPMAGVAIFAIQTFNTTISLPNGVRVELSRELVPEENLIGVFGGFQTQPIDYCHALRIFDGDSMLSEGRWQFNLSQFSPTYLRISAGLFIQENSLRVYAHLGQWNGSLAEKEVSPAIVPFPLPIGGLSGGDRTPTGANRGVFGRGVSLYADCPGEEPSGFIEINGFPDGFGYLGFGEMYAHPFPLDETMDLIPSPVPITERESTSLAWGRHPAAVAIGPVGWQLSGLESDGHPEWENGGSRNFAGASRLFRNGREAALVPASNHRSNVSPVEAENVRLKTLRVQWTWQGGLTTGPRDIGLLFGAWNEYRMENWGALSGSLSDGAELTGAFIAAAVTRIDATNLGSAVDQADAVEITRYALRWFAAVRYRFGDDLALTGWFVEERSVILSTADGAKLLAGEMVTLSMPTVNDPPYLQGTYPTPSLNYINGTFTVQAIGS